MFDFFRLLTTRSTAKKGYAHENGWTTRTVGMGKEHHGRYFADGFRWTGMVRENGFGRLEFWIQNPPIQAIRQSAWAGCFHARDNKWFLVTFMPGREPQGLDSGIAAIEHVLHATFGAGLRRA